MAPKTPSKGQSRASGTLNIDQIGRRMPVNRDSRVGLPPNTPKVSYPALCF